MRGVGSFGVCAVFEWKSWRGGSAEDAWGYEEMKEVSIGCQSISMGAKY